MSVFHCINGKIVAETDAVISALDLGLLRGYGVFDYAQCYSGRPFHLRAHIERLLRSASAVELDVEMSIDEIENQALDVIKKNAPVDAGIRFVITGGLSNDLLLPSGKATFYILFHPCQSMQASEAPLGVRAITTSVLRYLPHVKTTNYMPAIFARKKAFKLDAYDALYLNSSGGIIEGTTCNVFFVKNGKLITDDSNELIKGITRELLLNIAKDHYAVEYRALNINEISSCEEAFLTSSVKDLVSLVQIDDQMVGNGTPGAVTAHLRALYHLYIENYLTLELQEITA
jgi:branched-chain amino acid aminotransferase